MKTTKIHIENTSDFKGKIIRVFKSDFEIYKHDISSDPYYSISLKNSHGVNNVWGGDSACEDFYSKENAKCAYEDWDGTLFFNKEYGYSINE